MARIRGNVFMEQSLSYTYIESPAGRLLLAGDNEGLHCLYFQEGRGEPYRPPASWHQDARPFVDVTRQLQEYFTGTRRQFELPLKPEGTPFQLTVWRELQEIPYGKTISYGELARRIGNPSASRAVGLANGSNPISIIIPCHRVIGSNGKLTGYGGGLPNKQMLLNMERENAPGDLWA